MRNGLLRRFLPVLVLVLGASLSACRDSAAPSGQEGDGTTDGGTSQAGVPTEAAEMPIEEDAAGSGSLVPADSFVMATIGEPQSLDPAWTYETSGAMVESNLYDGLVYFDRESPDEFVPALASEWSVSDDGLTYTFTIREGVTFHAGGTLEPHDIAYSFHRAMLQDRADGPMWLFLEPLLGTSSVQSLALERGQVTDEAAEITAAPAEMLAQVCEDVKASVVADDEAGTVTINVLQPTPWFLQLLAQPWGSALDMEWMIEQGDWNGDCATWTEWHSPLAPETVLFEAANGTGPYMLDLWKKTEEITLNANENYWRSEPVWEGGPVGTPALKRVVIQTVDEWGTRLAKLQAGEADLVVVPRGQIDQVEGMIHTRYDGGDESAPSEVVNENGSLKLFVGYPSVATTAAMFNFDINAESEFIGSGQLGDGIPPDFFSDIDVRKAFNYCFDFDALIADGLKGEGIQARGPIIAGLPGHDESSDVYTFNPELCAEHLAAAWGGQVAEQGFSMTLAFNEGNETRQTAAEILADGLAAVDPKYKVEVQSLVWASFLDARSQGTLPIAISGWLEDYHDSSNWVHPFMHSAGAYAGAQSFPADLQTLFDTLIEESLVETDETVRAEIYTDLQTLAYDNAIDIFLYQETGRAYMDRNVTGWFNNPLKPGLWFYGLSKDG